MPLIGITGGIGTGKSTAAEIFRELGAVTFSADEAAREVLKPGSEGLTEVIAAFGPQVIGPDGALDRARLAEIVFADSDARDRLEKITHPRILKRLRAQIDRSRQRNPPGAVIAVEAPLLFEAGMEDWFDHIVVVTAPEDTQIARLRARSNLTEDEARARIRAQMPLTEKAGRAHHVIGNDGTLDDLRSQVKEVWSHFIAAS